MGVMISGSDAPCRICYQTHRDLARIHGPFAPDDWLSSSAAERLEAELTPDICLLPHRGVIRHFIRGHLQLPVLEFDSEAFVWSIWAEVDAVSMTSIARMWCDPNRAASAPLSGRLATELPYGEPTKGMPVTIYTRDPGMTPLLMVPSASHHRIAQEQRHGIDLHRVAEFTELLRR